MSQSDRSGRKFDWERLANRSRASRPFPHRNQSRSGPVLDNTCLLWLSSMFSGSVHDNSKLPVLTLGSLGSTLATGRVLDYGDKGEENLSPLPELPRIRPHQRGASQQ
jgi:hypothetical protein